MADILVGDDEQALLDFLQEHLMTLGHDVRTACDGPSVLEEIRSRVPDLVILDLKMPGMNGEDVIHRMTKMAPPVRAILISAIRTPSLLDDADEDHIVAFLRKPINLDELDRAVTHALREKAKP